MFDPPPNSKKMELICLDADTVEVLVEKIVGKIREEYNITDDPHLTTQEACRVLKCKKGTLTKYWKEGNIARAEFSKGHILYDRESIIAFIKRNTKKYDDGSK
jgi:hypothetical protein